MSSNGQIDVAGLPIEQRAKAVRDALGFTQMMFASEVGVNVRQVKRWEAGQIPSEESAHAIAKAVQELKATGEAPRWLKVPAELLFEPRERREERLVELENRVAELERRLRKAGL